MVVFEWSILKKMINAMVIHNIVEIISQRSLIVFSLEV